MKLSGTVNNRKGKAAYERVVAVGERQSLLASTMVQQDGQWSLETIKPAKWIIAQMSGCRMAAVATGPTEAKQIKMPDLVRLEFLFENALYGAALWLDPVQLKGFPSKLLWALRTHPHHIVDLHLAEFPMIGTGLQLYVQRGRYKFSGGRIALRPGADSLLLTEVRNELTGTISPAINGEVVVDVCEPATYRICLAEVERAWQKMAA